MSNEKYKTILPDDYKGILPQETVNLNKWLFYYHRHDNRTGHKVYREEDVFNLIKLLRANKI